MGVARIFLIGLSLCVGATCHAQIVDRVNLSFDTGNRGLAHTLILKVELMGGDAGEKVLAYGEINPPETAGFPANMRSSAILALNQSVNLRMVRRARLSIRGDRPGQDITTAWDVKSIRVDLSKGVLYWEYPTLNNVVLDSGRPVWVTPGWITYDPSGVKSKVSRMTLEIRSGADDLRSDAGAGAIVLFGDGSSYRVNICGEVGMAPNSAKSFPIALRTPQSLNDVQGIYMFHSAFLSLGQFNWKFLNPVQRFTNADGWDLAGADLSATLDDRAVVRRSFTGLLKHYSESVGFDVKNQAVAPVVPVRDIRALKAKIMVFIDGEDYNPMDKNGLPEIAVYFKFRGSPGWQRFITRTSPNQEYMALNMNAMWANDPRGFTSDNGIFGPRSRSILRGTSRIWQLGSAPVSEIEVRLVNGPGDNMGSKYEGGRNVKIRGFWFGYVPADGPDYPLADQMVTLGADFHDAYELSKTRTTRGYAVNHLMPPAR